MPMQVRTTLPAALALLLVACGASQESPAVLAPPALETLTVAASDGRGGSQWDGVVQAVEQATLSAQTSGRVSALAADVDVHVARGAVLVRLTSVDQRAAVDAARAQLRAAEAQLADAANRFQRASELVARQLISRDDFDRVQATHNAAIAGRDAATAQLAQAEQQMGYTEVRAPYAGVISARHVELGETVVPGQPLFTLYAPGQLRLEVQVPQGEADALSRDAAATVTLPDGREVGAAKVLVYPSADPLAHSVTVRVNLPALAGALRPGQTAKVRFAGSAGPPGIWVPASAVVQRGELSGCYVVEADGIVLRQLRVGERAGDRVQIIAGLKPGERVALDPLAALQALRDRQSGDTTRRE
jgi:RND family efflux transporter MFP subunit